MAENTQIKRITLSPSHSIWIELNKWKAQAILIDFLRCRPSIPLEFITMNAITFVWCKQDQQIKKTFADSTVGLGLVITDFIVTSKHRHRINTNKHKMCWSLYCVCVCTTHNKHFWPLCGHFNQSQFVMLEQQKTKSAQNIPMWQL